VAVLPLKNLSGAPAQDYFAEGMTEALITELGKISSLQVLSYQSVIGYRQTAKPLPEIARELKVDALLEGAALRSGDRVRVTANLVQVGPERHLWAESYEFDPRDILAAQGEVARAVARQIRVRLTPQEQARLTTSRRVDPEAYEAYLLGRAYSSKARTRTSWTRAKEYFEKAIARDPAYAHAYASLAELYMRPEGSPTRDPRDLRLQARRWAEKALELDDTLAEAHTVLARAYVKLGMNQQAVAELQKALIFNERAPLVLGALAHAYARAGQREEALKLVGELKRIEAEERGFVPPFGIIWAYAGLGDEERAFACLERSFQERRDRMVWLNVDPLLDP